MALAALPAILWSLAVIRWATVPFMKPPYAPGPLYTGSQAQFRGTDPAAQWHILTEHPARFLALPLETLRHSYDLLLRQMVGLLGLLDLPLPSWLFAAWVMLAAYALLAEAVLAPRPAGSALRFPVHLAAAAGSMFLIFWVQFLTWTDVGMPLIEGIQGRYFLPLVATVAVGLPSVPLLRARVGSLLPFGPLALICLLQFAAIPTLVVRRYYMH